ncbi:hypothetical protein N9L76_01770 [bacterium]|nr:hypothetical protein [bacterium]|tara:strand:- start:16871 stop:18205 length:1335 start_codon:yes stop_codon:yes gene_type:complete
MQFLESTVSALNKVDALAAEVIPPRRAGHDEDGEDVLEQNAGSVNTTVDVEALAVRLGLGPIDSHTPKHGNEAYEPGDLSFDEPNDPLLTSQRTKLGKLINELRVLEKQSTEAKAKRDAAVASAVGAEALRTREETDAQETLQALQREIDAEKTALETFSAQSAERENNAVEGDANEFEKTLAEAKTLVATRLADAHAMKKRVKALESEADALETTSVSAIEKEKEEEATTSSTETEHASRRAATQRLCSEISVAETELSALLEKEETVRRRKVSASNALSSFHEPNNKIETRVELEQRLDSLTAQLSKKRSETQKLHSEEKELERVVADVLMERRRVTRNDFVSVSDTSTISAVSGGGLKRRGGSSGAVKMGVRARVISAANRVDKISIRAGRHLKRSGGWRSAALIYALFLHVFAFAVLAYRALSGGPELKPMELVEGSIEG